MSGVAVVAVIAFFASFVAVPTFLGLLRFFGVYEVVGERVCYVYVLFGKVNRLRQVTSAIKQDGANQVSIITSSADREAAIEFAKAAALRPRIVGEALQRVAADPDVAQALFEALETQRLLDGGARITMLPKGSVDGPMLASLLATRDSAKTSPRSDPPPVPRGH